MRCDEATQESCGSVRGALAGWSEMLERRRGSVEMKHHGRAGGVSKRRRDEAPRKSLGSVEGGVAGEA